MEWGLKLMLLAAVASGLSSPPLVDVFTGGSGGYACYRIPALVVVPGGELLAFAEGRKFTCADHDWNDIVLKRSFDGGRTWSALQVVYGESKPLKHVTIGNPAPVWDAHTKTLFLPCCRNNQDVLLLNSTDMGKTWSQRPVDITAQVKAPQWTWYATGPPGGMQLNSTGRLVVPSDHTEGPSHVYGSHVMYSDDHGLTWQSGASVPNGNECQAAMAPNGSLALVMRTSAAVRAIAFSNDGGQSWTPSQPILQETACESSVVTLPNATAGATLVLSSAFSANRSNMTLHVSRDSGQTWQLSQTVYPGSAAYSSLAVADHAPDNVLLLFERDNYAKVSFVSLHI